MPTLDREGNVVGGGISRSPDKRKALESQKFQQEYSSAASIIQNAKTEKYMLDYERFKYKPKKESFEHKAIGKDKINATFTQINQEIDKLSQQVVNKQLYIQKEQLITKHNSEITSMQETYKQLQKDADVETALERLRNEIKETTVERDRMRIECQNMDLECKDKVDELNRLKDMHNDQAEERKFMEEQIINAIDGQARLFKKKDELTEELRKLEEMEAERRDENGKIKMKQSAAEREMQENAEYYESMRKKLSDYMGHLQKRNEAQRQ